MNDLNDPQYDRWRALVENMRSAGLSWEEVLLGGKPDVEQLALLLKRQVEDAFMPPLGTSDQEQTEVWTRLVEAKRDWEENSRHNERVPVVIGPECNERAIVEPSDSKSSWQLYRKRLLKGGFKTDDVEAIRDSALKVVRRLRSRTALGMPVKGMIVGHVQSGKTANMAGVMSVAADYGWNLFIVLSGSLENLRVQTAERLFSDLSTPGNLSWTSLDRPSPKSPAGQRAHDLHFGAGNNRYLSVSLKNAVRLRNLINWMKADPRSLSQMQVLIIDDEADQAGVNTKKEHEERARINGLIVELTQLAAKSVNYVAFTATPYANFLNEAYPDSLYPQSFILTLPQSDEHFGPGQVFGLAGADNEGGLGIVNHVPHEEQKALSGKAESSSAPQSLRDSIEWFLCASAAMRAAGGGPRPISMLVHTSSRQADHAKVATLIADHLDELRSMPRARRMKRLKKIWDEQTNRLSLQEFRDRLPAYGRLEKLEDYPEFQVLEPHLEMLLSRVSHIQMEEKEKGLVEPDYHSGVHLCIDNCANNGIDEEGQHVRLLYPSKKQLVKLEADPAFIVVGGGTLSRGLTIENLVSTYFLRGGAQMDTLMQMGRWFGYRRGYELLPRLWMPDETREKFVYMAGVEADLRDDLRRFMYAGADPKRYGPRVQTHPRASWLRPTAKTRMQAAIGAKYDFSALNSQSTIFHSTEEMSELLESNLKVTQQFLSGLSGFAPSPRPGAYVARSVPLDEVGRFLKSLRFHKRSGFFADLDPFVEWCGKNSKGYEGWSVVVAGRDPEGIAAEDTWGVQGFRIGKVSRTRVIRASDNDSVSIGTLRDPPHLLADADEVIDLPKNAKNSQIAQARADAGLGMVPQLLIYRIDKDSKPREKSSIRAPLNVPRDLIGISIWLPDAATTTEGGVGATHVTVRIPPELSNLAEEPDSEEDLS